MHQPLEPSPLVVQLMQSRKVPIHIVQIAHQPPHPLMPRMLEQMPVQPAIRIPLRVLRKLPSHEQQLLPRISPEVPIQIAQPRELLPLVSRHTPDHRPLAVHHFVMRQRQHEVLAVRVHQPEGDLLVMVLAVDRIGPRIRQRVVHPPHVPLVVKPQPAVFRRLRHTGKARRLFRDGHSPRTLHAHHAVHAAQEIDGLQVLAPALRIRHPLAGLAAVVAVQHRRHRIHAQAVHAVALQPVQRIADEVVAHLRARVVEDQRLPVVVETLARVGVLVQRGAIEVAQAVRVGGEVRWHPVEDHAQPRGMRGFDEMAEVAGCAEARGRRIQADRLVAPRAIERVLGDGQQLDVREAQVAHVGHERVGQLAVVQPFLAVVLAAP
ncbi:hypothetical protein D9M68_603340 [compost metagenome]